MQAVCCQSPASGEPALSMVTPVVSMDDCNNDRCHGVNRRAAPTSPAPPRVESSRRPVARAPEPPARPASDGRTPAARSPAEVLSSPRSCGTLQHRWLAGEEANVLVEGDGDAEQARLREVRSGQLQADRVTAVVEP